MYEVNANGNRTYRNTSAKKAAGVAVSWMKHGLQPKAWAIGEVNGKLALKEVAVTTIEKTSKALASVRFSDGETK